MHKTILTLLLTFFTLTGMAQDLRVRPTLSAASGSYDDMVSVEATFPEGCEGGKYWIDGGEITATTYSGPITIDYSCALSVAGTDHNGRIITDVVTHRYDIRRVTPPSVSVSPSEGIRKESFYVTRLSWHNVTSATCDMSAYKPGGSHYGQNVVWLTGPDGNVISGGDANNLWLDGLNSYKAYIYRNYEPTQTGSYQLHIAGGIFVLDGKTFDDELVFNYEVANGAAAPVFSPQEGTYKGSVSVSIDYPTDGTAFYKIYRLNGGSNKQYNAPITISETTKIEAYGMDANFDSQTPVAVATYTIIAPDPAPEIIAAPIITLDASRVSISAPAGTTVKYWMDHKMSGAQLYSAPFNVTSNCHIACVAYNDHAVSPTAELIVDTFTPEESDFGNSLLITPLTTETAHLLALSPNGRYAAGYIGSDTSSKGFVWDLEADRQQYASTIFVNQLWDVDDTGTAFGWRTRTTDIDESQSEADLLWGSYKDGVWTEMTRAEFEQTTFPDAPEGHPAVTALSADGTWAILGQSYRWNRTTGAIEYLTSTTERSQNSARPEVLLSIANDGTIFGTYDTTLLSPEKGIGLVRTNDGRWRDVAAWLREEKGFDGLEGFTITSVRDVTGDGQTLALHASANDTAIENAFTRGIVLRMGVAIKHLPPVGLTAEQMSGREVIKLSWSAPLTDAEKVTGYTIHRDGETIASVDATTFVYYDTNVSQGHTYSYTISATYADGRESSDSRESIAACQLLHHLPARNIALRHVGLSDLNLTWEAPIVSLPKLQYFGEENESLAFGTGRYDAEFGIRINASDLLAFEGQQVRTFQFLPSGPQLGYTLNMYWAKEGDNETYEDQPFYSQSINPATLNYGTVNTIELSHAQELKQGRDLYVTLLINSNGDDNMLGVSYEGFRSGYTDLCRIVGIHNKMVAISQNSQQTTEIVLPLGIGICSEDEFEASMVSDYTVTDNGKNIATTRTPHLNIEQVSEGTHKFAVTANYRDGQSAEPTEATIEMCENTDAYTAVTPEIISRDDNTALLSWTTPLDDDRNSIHWGNLTPGGGWPAPEGIYTFAAIASYPATMTATYADDYKITELFFYPMAEVRYNVALESDGEEFASIEPEKVTLNEINYIPLSEPVTVNPSANYHVVVNAMGVTGGVVALGYDSSGKWHNGYSNIVNYGDGNTTLLDFVQIEEQPNWLIGMIVRKKEARPLPLKGYDIIIDGSRQNSTLLTATEYTTEVLKEGNHTAAVNAVYKNDRTVEGRTVNFYIGTDGIRNVTTTDDKGGATTPEAIYDLAGRRIVNDKEGHALYIINNKKICTH